MTVSPSKVTSICWVPSAVSVGSLASLDAGSVGVASAELGSVEVGSVVLGLSSSPPQPLAKAVVQSRTVRVARIRRMEAILLLGGHRGRVCPPGAHLCQNPMWSKPSIRHPGGDATKGNR